MEKYVKLSDINRVLEKLTHEPAYYHDGEDFYNGISAVDSEISSLPTIELGMLNVDKWLKTSCSEKDGDAICPACGH